MTEKIAAQLQEVYNNKSRTAKNLIPQGRIPDLGWNTDQQGRERQQLTEPESPATQNTSQTDEGPPPPVGSGQKQKNHYKHKTWTHRNAIQHQWTQRKKLHRSTKCKLSIMPGLDGKQF